MALTPGTRLGPYEVTAKLGEGGMGEVYRGRDTRLGRTVAIKVLPAELAAHPDRRRRFEQEARAVSALNHPHICTLFDVGAAAGDAPGAPPTDYLVMECLEGSTLADRLVQGPLPLREVVEVGAQVAGALAMAHRHGVLHRDIKPGNVMLTRAGAKLLDFGLAKARPAGALDPGLTVSLTQGPVTSAGLVVGTVPYMAPEVLQGKEVDARADIFALGAVLYEMVSGRRAFDGENQASLIAAIMTSDPAPLTAGSGIAPVTGASGVRLGLGTAPPALDRLIRRCLAKDPDERWQSAGDLGRQLEGLAEEWRLPGSGAQVGLPPPAPSRSRRRTAAWLALGTCAAAVLGSGAYLAGHRSAARPQPTFHRLTFRQGSIGGARFTPDGQTVIYTARFEGNPRETYTVRVDGVDSERRDTLKGFEVEAISVRNEVAARRGNRLAAAPLTGGAPRDRMEAVTSADWSPDGAQLAVTHWQDGRQVVEYPIGKVLYRAPDGVVSVDGVRVSPDGALVAFRQHLSTHGRVIVIDANGRTRTESSFVDGIRTPAWSADGREVWFSASTSRGMETVRALDLAGRERTALRSPGLVLQDVSRDGRALLASLPTVYSVFGRGPGDSVDRNLTHYGWSLLDDMTPDGRTVLFTEGGESDPANGWSVFLRPTDGSPPQVIGRGHYAYARLSPDAKWVATESFREQQGTIVVVPTGTGEERQVTEFGAGRHQVVGWLPDSSGFLYEADTRIWLAPLSGPPRAVTPAGWFVPPVTAPAPGLIAPDGRHFLCGNNVPGDAWGYLCEIGAAAGVTPSRVIDMSRWGPVAWTRDGRKLWVLGLPMGVPLGLFLFDPATGVAEPSKDIGAQIDRTGLVAGLSRLRLSADGESYAYSFGRQLGTLYVAEGIR